MKKTEIAEKCFAFGGALETLGYAMEFVNYNVDIEAEELRKIVTHIHSGIKCLADYHEIITDAIDNAEDEYMDEEERLVWVYRHMDEADKERLDRYCKGFTLGYDFRESSVVKGQGEADTP